MLNLPPKVHTLPSLVVMSLVKEEIEIFEIVTRPHAPHVIKGSSCFQVGASHSKLPPYLVLVSMGLLLVEI